MRSDELQALAASIENVVASNGDEIRCAVITAVSEAMNLPADDLASRTNLREIGIESLDMLDVTFRLEKRFTIKIQLDIVRDTLATVYGARLESDGRLTDDARDGLSLLMPGIESSLTGEVIRPHNIVDQYTIESLVRLIAWQLGTRTDRMSVA